jgi:hypothetical protein
VIHGSCLCGEVRFELDGVPQFINHCHCAMCRKAHGAAFGSFLHTDGGAFRWTAGEALRRTFESSPGTFRAFCDRCGSRLPVLEDDGTHVIIPAGLLDDDPGVRPTVHIHAASKAPWFDITDALPQFDGFPPDDFWEAQAAPTATLRTAVLPPALAGWHHVVQTRDADALDDLLASDVVFHSPVVHTPQVGRPITSMYLGAAVQVFGNDSFRYVRQIVGAHDAMLEFEVEIDGIVVNGIDLITWNDADRIVAFKVMIRPLKAISLIHQKMAALLQAGH